MTARVPLLIAWIVVVGTAPAQAADELAQIADCVRQNLPADSSVQVIRMVTGDHVGNEREVLATVTWKRFDDALSRVVIRVNSPEDLRGAAVLLAQREGGADLFLYSPELRKTRRITTRTLSGNLFGSDFTYEDFLLLSGMAETGTSERLPDTDVDGQSAYALAQRAAADAGSGYERVVVFIDRESCVLMKAEMYESGDRLRKVMKTDRESIFERDGVRIPRRVVLEDVKRGSSTRLEAVKIDLDKRVSRRDLSVSALER